MRNVSSITVPLTAVLASFVWGLVWMAPSVRADEADTTADALVDFDTQVIPVLTKAGCNAGACHGAAAGRGDFFLSLYGSRIGDDYLQITRALKGRRIDYRQPEFSLLLLKPTESVSHGGGTRIDVDSPHFSLLKRWIAQGAQRLQQRRLVKLSFSADRTEIQVGESVSLQVIARFDDGLSENVLSTTVITSTDPSALPVSESGTVTAGRPGRYLLLARFLDRVVPLEIIVPRSPRVSIAVSEASSKIDQHVNRRLRQLGLQQSPAARAGVLVRRLCLDLTGRLPDSDLHRKYSAGLSVAQRASLVDHLLDSDAFHDYQTHLLAQLLRLNQISDATAATSFHHWLRGVVVQDRPLTELVRELILSEGSVQANPAANFYSVTRDAREQAEYLTEAFLGVRLKCANCHDHPLDSWTQDDYHGLSAIFAGIKRGSVIRIGPGEVIHPATGDPAVARIPGVAYLKGNQDHRGALSDWMTSSDNRYFARVAVNRIWSRLMGRGLVEPVDDLRVTNPASHPELLDWLAQEFIADGYRMKPIIRRICLSDTYACSSATINPAGFEEFYGSAFRKPLSPEVFLDAISDVTGVAEPFGGDQRRSVSLEGLTAESAALDLLGRCSEREICGNAGVEADDLSVQLHLLNGAMLNQRLAAPDGELHKMLRDGVAAQDLVTLFYGRALGREPAAAERQFWISQLQNRQGNVRKDVAEDFVWSLLNSRDFMTSH